jgi:hypothetical protein
VNRSPVPGAGGLRGSGRRRLLGVSAAVTLLAIGMLSGSATPAPGRVGPAETPSDAAASTLAKDLDFTFVANFENKSLAGWQTVSGSAPKIQTRVNYSGEPALRSVGTSTVPQIETDKDGFVRGDSGWSLEAALRSTATSAGYFGLGVPGHQFGLVIGVRSGMIVAGGNLSNLTVLEPVPVHTAYPAGWVYLTAGWDYPSTDMFVVSVDGSSSPPFVAHDPNALNATSVELETTSGTVYYTDLMVTTDYIPGYFPGFNNMTLYGEGSGSNVELLPTYNELSATMTLGSWSVPKSHDISWQINAMNISNARNDGCSGFFQLGVDLDSAGHIAPWYVNGDGSDNCQANYWPGNWPGPGTVTPAGTVLELTIHYEKPSHTIVFKIVDLNLSKTWTHSIPYSGPAFVAASTQFEAQPQFSSTIAKYKMKGWMTGVDITPVGGTAEVLSAQYMTPILENSPPTWDETFYNASIGGYELIST